MANYDSSHTGAVIDAAVTKATPTTLGTSEVSKCVTVDASGDLIVPDSDEFKFGTGGDMKLYHDGSNSFIQQSGTGALKLATEDSGKAVSIGHTTSETTVNDNLTVTGNLSVTGTSPGVSSVEMFYPVTKAGHARGIEGYYLGTGNLDDGEAANCSGVAPNGFQSVSNMFFWFLCTANETFAMTWGFQCGGGGAAWDDSSQANNTEFTAASVAMSSGNVYAKTMANEHGGTVFETEIASGDAFGISIINTSAHNMYALGVSIRWVF